MDIATEELSHLEVIGTIVAMLNKGAKGKLVEGAESEAAAEARAKIVYERLINLTDDAGVKDALTFLMTREIAHQKSFEKALYAIEPNFPPGKLQGKPEFTSVYYNMSQGEGDTRGPWNQGEQWQFVEAAQAIAVDGGSGLPTVGLTTAEETALQKTAMRTQSAPDTNPLTGAELGSLDGSPALNGAPTGTTSAKKTLDKQV